MFLPLVDTLRCPRSHEETWLVASIDRVEERDIVEGVLGCPACEAEYPIRDGIVFFDEDAPRAAYRAPSEEEAFRLAAALDLTDPRMTAILHGAWGAQAPIVCGVSPAQILLVNPPPGTVSGDGISIVCANAAPLARGSVSGVALDAGADASMVASLVASLKPGGRMLGPVSVPIPEPLMELVRDDEVWVAAATSDVTSAPILPTRRPK